MTPRRHRLAALELVSVLAFCLLLVSEASAVVIATGDGSGNTTPPTNDPGFANVGIVNLLSGVYVRNGWVLTAAHVGAHPIDLGGIVYEPIPDSGVQFQNPDSSYADLYAFKLAERPPLPDLLITNNPPAANTLVTLVGRGRNRGVGTTWMGYEGWAWGAGAAIRWGTNRIAYPSEFSLGTETFWTIFDDLRGPAGGQHEADVVTGDSGGAAFTGSGASAELVGIMMARATFQDQPAGTSLYGNGGIMVDLFDYRDDLLAVIDQPDCDDGLDDDGDGFIDYPADPGCTSPTDASERDPSLVCDNELDDDNDGYLDEDDPGCAAPDDSSERGPAYQCDNGIDDDLDGLTDYPDDTGCLHPTNIIEAPEPLFGATLLTGLLALSGLARFGTRGRSIRAAAQAPSSTRSTR